MPPVISKIVCCIYYSPAIREISPHHQWDLLLSQLFDSDLKGIGLSFHIHQDRRIHTVKQVSPTEPNYNTPKKSKANLICNALVPSTLAFSYLVIYGVVVLLSLGIRRSRMPLTVFNALAALAASASPVSTT
jgi:hypothetical protein